MSSKVASFFGESLSAAVFARKEKTELEENIDNWYAYLFNVVEKERKELFYRMVENDGKVYPKDLVRFKNKFSDALGWLWINVFLAGDKSVSGDTSFSNVVTSVAEFTQASDQNKLLKSLNSKINEINEQIKTLEERKQSLEKRTTNLESFLENNLTANVRELIIKQMEKAKQYKQIGEILKGVDKNNTELIAALKQQRADLKKEYENFKRIKTEKPIIIDGKLKNINEEIKTIDERIINLRKQRRDINIDLSILRQSDVNVTTKPDVKTTVKTKTKKTRKVIEPKKISNEKLTEEAAKRKINVDDVKRLQEITQRQRSDATGFINDTDFGRVYVQQRRDYIAQVYTEGDTKKNMLGVFDKMNEQYEAGKASPPIQKYFERKYMRKKDGVTTIGGETLETEPPITVGGVTLAGKRKSPKPVEKNNPLRELNLYEDVRKTLGKNIPGGDFKDGSLKRIVETEVVAAYNMGRLHQMFTSDVKFVRWVNDVENRKSGKVCQICTIRAMGTSESLRKFARKESLSGIYTIEDAFTNRQLAIPSHPFCLCQLRPINDKEEELLVAAGVFEKMGQTTTAAAIAAIGVEGLNNTQLATEGTDRSSWWYGALAAGGTAVAIGAMMWYLRKSLVGKYAADITKRRGREGIETLNRKSGRLGEITVPSQQQLDDSLRIKDDLPKIVDGVDINASNIKPEKYNKKLLERFPELGTELPPLEDLTRTVRDEAEDLLFTNSVENVLVQRSKEAFNDSAISDNLLRIQLEEQRVDLGGMLDRLRTKYTEEDALRPFVARTIVDTEKNIKVVDDLLSQVDSRKIQLPDTPLSKAEIYDIFANLEPIRINTQNLQMNQVAGETFSTKVKEVTVDITKRYADGGVVDGDITRLTQLVESLGERQTISFSDYQRISKQLRRIERERAFADLAVTRGNVNLFAEIQNFMENATPDALSRTTRNIYNKNLQHKTLLSQVSDRLAELKTNTPTYKQKLVDGEVVDRFVGEVTPNRSAKNIKRIALDERKSAIKEIEDLLKLLDKKGVDKDLQTRRELGVKDIVDKLDLPENIKEMFDDNFIDTFIDADKADKIKILRKIRNKLIGETRRIRDVEFNRFQQKWAMFGSPK